MRELVDAAAARVERWITVPDTWVGHRPEPLVAERLWACGAVGEGTRHAGLDGAGRAILVGPTGRPPARWAARPNRVDVVEHAADGRAINVHGFGRLGEQGVTTTFDDAGRPLATSYAGAFPDERYELDAGGRLVAIEESPGVRSLSGEMEREDPAGVRLDVEWRGGSPVAVRRADDGFVVWERLALPWPDALRGFAEALAEAAAAKLSAEAEALGVEATDEVFGMALVTDPVPFGTANLDLWVGLQTTRERVLADRRLGRDEVEEYLWWLQNPDGDSLVAGANLPDDLDRAALRAASMHDAREPRRTLARATVPLLAARDWSGSFTVTPDFAAYVIGEDDGPADLYASMVAGNPPERLAARAAMWRGSRYPPTD